MLALLIPLSALEPPGLLPDSVNRIPLRLHARAPFWMMVPMSDSLTELRQLAMRHAPVFAVKATTAIRNLGFWASRSPKPPTPFIYEPMLYFALQGSKRIMTGDRVMESVAGDFVIGSLDLPVMGQVLVASPRAPYISVAVKLEPAVIAGLLLELPPGRDHELSPDTGNALVIGRATDQMRDALVRLVRLLDEPHDIPLLAPMIERELLYRVLQSPGGPVLRQIARSDSRLSQVQRVVKWIRAHLAEPLPVETLAGMASMSLSSFHRHFKTVTGQSPLAFQKQMRLQEARLRLLAEPGGGVASVAFAVGYESASQFSREYARQFGISPGRDAARLRAG
jgi:AraC-like DNA-binding protein